jgi:hypothetical protein
VPWRDDWFVCAVDWRFAWLACAVSVLAPLA